MKKDNKVYLEDIHGSVQRIEAYVKDANLERFSANLMMQDAVIRQFEIIGEAASKLDEDFLKNNPSFPVREAVAMRNILIHEYNYVNIEQVWKTIQEDLPKLKKEIKELL